MSSTNTSRVVRVCPICLFLILPSLAPTRDDQKTPSTEIFLDENRLSGIIIYSDTISFTMDRFYSNADRFYILQPLGLPLYQ
jgi:hypothetical protein